MNLHAISATPRPYFWVSHNRPCPHCEARHSLYSHHECARGELQPARISSVYYCECDPCSLTDEAHYFESPDRSVICDDCRDDNHPVPPPH